MTKVTINLSQSADAMKLDINNIIHQSQFNQAIKMIKSGLLKATDNKEETKEHIHEAITILGTRGSGKTTFLLSLREYIKKQKDLKVEILDIIDPTLIEEKGHIFLNIISIIDDLVRKKFDKCADKDNFQELISLNSWNNIVLKLSHGLPSMDGVGGTLNEVDWQDAEYIMEKGLRSVKSARELAENFQSFARDALFILEKDVFLLAFDDIDIDFKKGWAILETIRKYLHTSKIITLLSGDLKLYTLSIRKQYWNNFGKSMLINEGDKLNRHAYFNDRITELESQYILKVIKPERRIHLNSLYEKLQLNKSLQYDTQKNDIYIQTGNKGNDIEIEAYYIKILHLFGIKNKYQSEAYFSFLLGLPLRTQIQFLSQFELNPKDLKNVNVIDAFLSELIEQNVNTSLIDNSPKLLNVEILNLLIRHKKLNDLYQLQPITSDIGLNSCLTSLSLQSSIKISDDPYLIFDYFIKIGYLRNLLGFLGYENETENSADNLTPSIEGLCNYSGIYQNKVLRDIACNITSYIKGAIPNNNNSAGIIPLLGLSDTAKKSGNFVSNRIDEVFKNSTYDQKTLGFIPLSISSYTTINRSIPCYSIYTLLATIGELIRKADQDDLPRGLAELSEVRTFSIPEFKKRVTEKIDPVVFISKPIHNHDISDLQLAKKTNDWVEDYKKRDIKISTYILGKISTRFFYALNSIENIEDTTNLGEMMHTRIVALMNAILIEDVKENIQQIDGFNINNTNLKDDIFIKNLELAADHHLSLQFSQWLISCPLLIPYLNLNKRLLDALHSFNILNNNQIPYYSNNSIFYLLKQVSTKSNKRTKQYKISKPTSNYNKIIETLIERKTPFSLFEESEDRKLIREKNDQIRANLTDVFGQDLTSNFLRTFRKYLKATGRKW